MCKNARIKFCKKKCKEGCERRQRCILQSTQANNNNNLQRNRIDTVESVDNVLLLGNIVLHLGAPHRREGGVCHAIPTTGGSYTYIQDGMLIPHKFPDRIGEGSL
ncbi:unnamed protein product, partial [Sphagnum compactum]